MAADDTTFGTEMRGYKKDEVDKSLQQLRAELIKANAGRSDSAKEVKRLLAVNEDLQAELDESGSPTYAGLGTKLENTLRVAEEQSTRLISQADIDAEKLRNTTAAEVAKLKADAQDENTRATGVAAEAAATLLAEARAEADSLVSSARADADAMMQDAMREAGAIRGAVATEAAELRTTSKREAAALRAQAEHEAAELKSTASRDAAEAREAAAELARDSELGRATYENENAQLRADLSRDIEQGRTDLARELESGRAELATEIATSRDAFENDTVSQRLTADLRDPSAHEAAALLLGAFALREPVDDVA